VSENGSASPGIGRLRETPLHAALKRWCAGPEAAFEVTVDGYVVDVVEGGELIEIQTRSFAKIKRKLLALVEAHPVRLVHPSRASAGSCACRRMGRARQPGADRPSAATIPTCSRNWSAFRR
jgi:hypothetical protein